MNIIDNIRTTRTNILSIIKELSIEELNKVPHGFNNNIIWNMGHLVATQQSICYVRGGLPPAIPDDVYKEFKPGTKPEHFFDSSEKDGIEKLLFSSLDLLQRDYMQNGFRHFVPWTTRMGIVMNNIEEALQYLFFHEGLHTGVITSLKKLVQQ